MQKLSSPGKWFDAAVAEATEGIDTWRRSRAHIIRAGFFFLKARECVAHGEWCDFLEDRRAQMSPRTVRRYVELAEAALAWSQQDEFGCKLSGTALIDFAITKMRMESPVPLVALLRQLNELRPFGEYDAVRYATQKRLANSPRQVEFNFVSVRSQIDELTHLDEPNYSWKFPEGTDEPGALNELKAKLATVIEKIDAKLRARPVIET
jgi:hypothetical protein